MREISTGTPKLHTVGMVFAVMLQGAGQTALLACLPLLNEVTEAGYPLLTAALSVSMVMVLLSAPFWGARSDRMGRLTTVRIALLGMFAGNLLLAATVFAVSHERLSLLPVIVMIFVSRLIYGAFVGGLYPSVQAYVLDISSHENRAKSLSRVSASINVGRLAGPALGFVAVSWGLEVLLILLSILPLLILPVLSGRVVSSQQYDSEEAKQSGDESLWSLCGPVLIMAVFVTSVFGVLQFSIGPVLQERLQLTAQATTEQLSLLMVVMSLITLVMHIICSRFMGARHVPFLRVGAAVLLTGCLILVQVESMMALWIGLSLAAASVMMMTPAYTAMAAGHAVSGRGKITGLLSMMHSGGYALGGMIAGGAMLLGVNAVMFAALLLALILFVIATLIVDSDLPHADRNNKTAPGVG